MTIAQEINDLKSRVSAAFSACEEKSASMPASRTTWTLADTIRTIPSGSVGITFDDAMNKNVSGSISGSAVKIPDQTFNGTSITAAIFPNCLTVGSSAFQSCSMLTTISVPACTTFGSSAFQSCSVVRSLTLSPSITSIGAYAFAEISMCKFSLDLPQCSSIGAAAFFRCNLLQTVNLPKLRRLLSSVFFACSTFTTVNLPSCTQIGSEAFYYCLSLNSISLPKCVTIYSGAFWNCKDLSVLSLPALTTFSGYAQFWECRNLASLYFRTSNMRSIDSGVFSGTTGQNVPGGFKIYVPTSLVTYYQTKSGWSYFSSRILPFDDWE